VKCRKLSTAQRTVRLSAASVEMTVLFSYLVCLGRRKAVSLALDTPPCRTIKLCVEDGAPGSLPGSSVRA